jgi:hypothetical protein
MNCMSAECFIDTNLFIYQLEALDARKTVTADHSTVGVFAALGVWSANVVNAPPQEERP